MGTALSHLSAVLSTSKPPPQEIYDRFFSWSGTIGILVIFWATAGPSGVQVSLRGKTLQGERREYFLIFGKLRQFPGALFRYYSMQFVWAKETGLCLAFPSSSAALCFSVSSPNLPSCQSAGADDELWKRAGSPGEYRCFHTLTPHLLWTKQLW